MEIKELEVGHGESSVWYCVGKLNVTEIREASKVTKSNGIGILESILVYHVFIKGKLKHEIINNHDLSISY